MAAKLSLELLSLLIAGVCKSDGRRKYDRMVGFQKSFPGLFSWTFGGLSETESKIFVCVRLSPLIFGFFPRRCAAVAFFFFFFPPSEFPSRNKLQHPLPPTTKTARLRRDSPIEPETLNSCLNYPLVLAKLRRGVARCLMVGKSRIG